ncbi:HNH endonuclease [Gordonia sp. X0973]|nr:HNH endonuclease signature motif containing protein [Gordonia sp. X0973]QKT09196.1 HNH endonuclease [Gordonia sp. X0973]
MRSDATSDTASDVFDDTAAADLGDEDLEERVLGYAAQIAALTGRFLEYLAEFDARGAWAGPGMNSCAQWLSWRAGMNRRTAQEHIRVAHALGGLPMVREHLLAGELSFSKVRALTRVATAEREPELVNLALSSTASQLERFVAAMGPIDRNQEIDGTAVEPRPIESYGSWRWNDDGSLGLSVRLNPVDGAHLLAGLVRAEYERTRTTGDPDLPVAPDGEAAGGEAAGGEAGCKPPRDLWRGVPANIAAALVTMADTVFDAMAIPQVAPGAEILVHETPIHETPIHGTPDGEASSMAHAYLDRGPALTEAQHEELRCGASTRAVGHDDSRYSTGPQLGPVLWWGGKRRYANAALIRVIAMRDVTCQAPGCERTHHLHLHHVTPWSAGGTTDPDNLILLCGYHHRALHDGDFVIIAQGKQRFRFQTPAGSELHPAPPIASPADWYPDHRVARDALTSEGNGPLDLGYATEVIYGVWDRRERLRRKAQQQASAEAAA